MKSEIDSCAKSEIILYQSNETVSLEVRMENETVWLSQQQIAKLFGTKRPAITKHLNNIYASQELDERTTCSILELMGNDGKQSYKTKFYNLDAILSVGYRVNSRNATLFRQWANKILKEYLLRGYSVNQRLQYMEEKMDRRFFEHEKILQEHSEKIDFFVKTGLPPREGLLHEGQIFDARVCVENLIKQAKREVIMQLKKYAENFHDRFLIIDEVVYHFGASFKDLGNRLFAFNKMGLDKDLILSAVKSKIKISQIKT